MIERTKPLDSNMEFIELSGTPLVVSRIGLGTWAIGGWMWGGTDEAQSIRTIHEAFDRGVNLFDTAPVYASGGPKKSSARRYRKTASGTAS